MPCSLFFLPHIKYKILYFQVKPELFTVQNIEEVTYIIQSNCVNLLLACLFTENLPFFSCYFFSLNTKRQHNTGKSNIDESRMQTRERRKRGILIIDISDFKKVERTRRESFHHSSVERKKERKKERNSRVDS